MNAIKQISDTLGHSRIMDRECTDAEAEKGCRECGGEISNRHWATLKWAAANWYCSRECADAVERREAEKGK